MTTKFAGAGWVLLFLEDGERKPIDLQRFEGVLIFWRQFVRRYLNDQPHRAPPGPYRRLPPQAFALH